MTDILSRIGSFAVETEATDGTAETIVAADVLNCVESAIIKNPNLAPRGVIRDEAQPLTPKIGGLSCDVSCSVELKGSGTAGTKHDPLCDLLEACGIAMTADAGYAVRGALSATMANQNPATIKKNVNGKYITACGVMGNPTFTLKAGERGILAFEGMGPLHAEGDESALAEASESLSPPILINNDIWFTEHHATTEDDCDGDGELLRGAAGYGEKLEKVIVQGSTTQKVIGIGVWLKTIGTPASETHGLWATIEGDTAGDPDGTPITNGTSGYLATTGISDTDWELYFLEFGSYGLRPTFTASTTYHVVLQGDWTQADANCISVDTDVVVEGSQNSQEYDGEAWNAVTLENLSMLILVAPDVENFFDGAEIKPNNNVVMIQDPNATQGWRFAKVTGYGDGVKATVTPLEKLDSEQDFWTELTAGTDCLFRVVLGTAAGNNIEFIFQHCTVSNAGTWDDREGLATHPLELHLTSISDFAVVMK